MNIIRDVIFILDGSSSMCGKEKEIMEEYNQMVEAYKEEEQKNLYITTAVFREKCDLLQMHMPVKYVKKLDGFLYYTYGDTAYYDSIIEVVKLMEELVQERSSFIVSEVFVIIIGDGMDNTSIRNTKEDFKRLVEKKQKEGWKFIERKKGCRI